MNNKNLSFIQSFQNLIINNFRNIIIIIGVIVILLVSSQLYIFIKNSELKENSIKFFNTIDNETDLVSNLQNLSNEKNIYSVLSKLKLIEINNKNNNYDVSNELYKELITSKDLNNLYKTAIATNASYALINASYSENTNRFLDDISMYISYISDELEGYASIKNELEYLKLITEIDINNLDYENNDKALELYNKVLNSSLISSSAKERVKKIHEFQLYK